MTDNNLKKISVLMTTSTLPRWKGDAEQNIVFKIAKNIKAYSSRLDITILAPSYPGALFHEKIDGIEIIRYRYFLNRHEKLCYNGGIMANVRQNKLIIFLIPFLLFFQLLNIIKINKKKKIDIIHAHWIIPQGIIAAIYKKLFNKKIKLIVNAHGVDVYSFNSPAFRFLKAFTLRTADHISAVSHDLASEIKNKFYKANNVSIIPNAINLNKFIPKLEISRLKEKHRIKSHCLLFVGRLAPKKGVIYIIKAMPKILDYFPDTKLLIVGYGQLEKKLKTEAAKIGLEKNIEFTGSIPNSQIPRYYNLADIFIGPSIVSDDNDTEGFGIVFIEAMACATPVITTATGGIIDIVIPNKNGLIVPPKDSEAIAKMSIDLLRNKDKRKLLGKYGRDTVINKFNWKKIIPQYINLYEK